ncbi:hypothetical protein MINTM018_41170 [Mycobacterium intracellulare]|uniref:Integral membrane protein n=1 Tax=Mycobacterium intracellulare TaxID=1767 RepID=A0A7R7MYS4_MYCIT|nr:hypothetical protein MINTM018_41170 [Mycobacterium intracellulare]
MRAAARREEERRRPDYAGAVTPPSAPTAVRRAGVVVAVQGMAALIVAVVLVVRGIAGADQHVANGLATAGWFVLVGAGVIAAGRALMLGKRWGRGLAVITQLLLLPVAWYLAVGSHQPGYGIPAGLVALVVLGLLFSPAAVRWAAGDQGDSASPANRDPDSR